MACHHLDQTFLKECNHLILQDMIKKCLLLRGTEEEHISLMDQSASYIKLISQRQMQTHRDTRTHTHTGQQTCWALPVV